MPLETNTRGRFPLYMRVAQNRTDGLNIGSMPGTAPVAVGTSTICKFGVDTAPVAAGASAICDVLQAAGCPLRLRPTLAGGLPSP
jgi:hypothetical protein